VIRIATTSHGPHTRLVTIGGSGDRWLNRLVDERDLAIGGTPLFRWMGALSDEEEEQMVSSMSAGYERMHAAEGRLPSPVLSTIVGRQDPGAFDAIVVEPADPKAKRPDAAVVFLHGFGGSFVLPCWQLAQAASDAGMLTICPSVGLDGDWWTGDGLATVRSTIAWLRARGVRRVVLVGLSDGAIGASELAPKLDGELAGLVLVSGASSKAAPPRMPVLVIFGRDDRRFPVEMIRGYVGRAAQPVEYVELGGGHFILLDHAGEVRSRIATWLRELP
jgi:pimeloyl-ACP methyl ester carboxylesterase